MRGAGRGNDAAPLCLFCALFAGCSDEVTPTSGLDASTSVSTTSSSVPVDAGAIDAGSDTAAGGAGCATPPAMPDVIAALVPGAANDGAPIDIAIRDMDRDGEQDVLIARGGLDRSPFVEQGIVEILYGPHRPPQATCGTTTTRPHGGRRWSSATPAPYGKLAVGDVDEDGCLDVAVARFDGGVDLFMSRRDGGGACTSKRDPVRLSATSPSDADVKFTQGAVGVSDVDLTDLNGDGKLDLVAARYHREYDLRPLVQQIYWNSGSGARFSDAHRWESKDRVVGAMTVLSVDVNRDEKSDVLFGARAGYVGTRYQPGWGVAYLANGSTLSDGGLVMKRPGASDNALGSPVVVDLDALPTRGGASDVLVHANAHWCNGVAECEAAAKPEVYTWAGSDMQRTQRFAGATSGCWLPATIGRFDANEGLDIAFGFACGLQDLRPGYLGFHLGPDDAPTSFAKNQYIIRAIGSGDLDPSGASRGRDEIAFGEVSTTTPNTGAVVLLFQCR